MPKNHLNQSINQSVYQKHTINVHATREEQKESNTT